MLWWLIGLWLASPALLPIVWLLGSLRRAPQEKPETASHRVAEHIMRDQGLHLD
jgi:hypothetical protein